MFESFEHLPYLNSQPIMQQKVSDPEQTGGEVAI